MTEVDWLTSSDPQAMLALLTGTDPQFRHHSLLASDRKLRLFACAIERYRMNRCAKNGYIFRWASLSQTEDEADGAARQPDFVTVYNSGTPLEAAQIACLPNADDCSPQFIKADILRDIFGNPWRPIKIPSQCRKCGMTCGSSPHGYFGLWFCSSCRSNESSIPWLTWNDGTVRKLAQAIYAGRHFEDIPILADALEEAGCANEDILRHCRGIDLIPSEEISNKFYFSKAGPHVRGCWIIDLILGKE